MTLSSNSRRCFRVAAFAELECHCGSSQKLTVLALPEATLWAKFTASSIARAPEQLGGSIEKDSMDKHYHPILKKQLPSVFLNAISGARWPQGKVAHQDCQPV